MSKITFRADEELVDELETYDASKSELMREALRQYIDDNPPGGPPSDLSPTDTTTDARSVEERGGTLDDLVAERVDALVARRLGTGPASGARDVNVNVTLEGDLAGSASAEPEPEAASRDEQRHSQPTSCGQCGEPVDSEHVYCPNCGEKSSRRVFCDCGDELRTDWAFCPSCGRRTPAADVLDGT